MIKKESGENPERSGHCKWKIYSKYHWMHTREGGVKIAMSQETCQNKMHINLPEKGDAWWIHIIFKLDLSVNSRPVKGRVFLH